MVEVFKTNITCKMEADRIVEMIHSRFAGYKANFDLSDCDNILRVQATGGLVKIIPLLDFLCGQECYATPLPDEATIPFKSCFGGMLIRLQSRVSV